MEAETKKPDPRQTVVSFGDDVEESPYVSPDVAAAMAGEVVEFGVDIVENPEN